MWRSWRALVTPGKVLVLQRGQGDWEPPEGFEQALTKPISQEARLLASPAALPHL